MDGIPPAMRGVPQIEVTFDIDANGIVNVSAKDLGTGKEQHITITAGSNMSDNDIEQAIKDAANFEAEDKKRKEKVETKNELESLIFQLEKNLKDLNGKVDVTMENEVNTIIEETKNILAKEDISDSELETLKTNKEKLLEKFQTISNNIYNQQSSMNNTQKDFSSFNKKSNNDGSKDFNEDDIIDGDFREV